MRWLLGTLLRSSQSLYEEGATGGHPAPRLTKVYHFPRAGGEDAGDAVATALGLAHALQNAPGAARGLWRILA